MSAHAHLGPAELYPILNPFVRRALAGLGVRSPDVEDLAHDVFITLHRKRCTFPNERAARAWLFATARRVASNDRRARARAHARTPGWAQTEIPLPDLALEHADAAARVQRFAEKLPAPAAEVFRLSEIEGLPAPEVADALGLKINTTYSHIRRVRRRFARTVAIGVGLLLLLVAILTGTCTVEGAVDRDRVALRPGANLAG